MVPLYYRGGNQKIVRNRAGWRVASPCWAPPCGRKKAGVPGRFFTLPKTPAGMPWFFISLFRAYRSSSISFCQKVPPSPPATRPPGSPAHPPGTAMSRLLRTFLDHTPAIPAEAGTTNLISKIASTGAIAPVPQFCLSLPAPASRESPYGTPVPLSPSPVWERAGVRVAVPGYGRVLERRKPTWP